VCVCVCMTPLLLIFAWLSLLFPFFFIFFPFSQFFSPTPTRAHFFSYLYISLPLGLFLSTLISTTLGTAWSATTLKPTRSCANKNSRLGLCDLFNPFRKIPFSFLCRAKSCTECLALRFHLARPTNLVVSYLKRLQLVTAAHFN
jgi:hypothetical protein